MSQNAIVLPTTGTVSGLQMTQSTNNALDTLNTLSSGSAAPSSPEPGQLWHDTANNLLKMLSLDGTTWIALLSLNESAYTGAPLASGPLGQCQFQYGSGGTCTLVPMLGNKVSFPSGAVATIPSGGISTAITNCYLNGTAGSSLAPNTLYYAYLWNAGTVTSPNYVIDWSTAGYATEAVSGIAVKNSDNTRVLVGMAYPLSGPSFSVTASAHLVRSWFRDQGLVCNGSYGAAQLWSSNSVGEPNSNIRLSFLSWANEAIDCQLATSAYNATVGNNIAGGIGLDSTSSMITSQDIVQLAGGTNYAMFLGGFYRSAIISEGFHYLTVLAQSPNSTQITLAAATALSLRTAGLHN